jgi:alkylglycerol monooxygenase
MLKHAPVIIPCIVMFLALFEHRLAIYRGISVYTKAQTFVTLKLIVGQAVVGLTIMVYLQNLVRVAPKDKCFDLPSGLAWQVVAFLFLDFLAYWNHRLSHHVPLFWADHAVHHANSNFNLMTHLTYGWTGFASAGLVFSLIVNLVGQTGYVTLAYFLVSLVVGTMAHTQLIHKLGFLEAFLVTPSHHRMHHAVYRQTHDGNYGLVLIIWDKLFGTFKPEGQVQSTNFGLANSPSLTESVWTHAFFGWKEFFLQNFSPKNHSANKLP